MLPATIRTFACTYTYSTVPSNTRPRIAGKTCGRAAAGAVWKEIRKWVLGTVW
jgi:hypothetical protein